MRSERMQNHEYKRSRPLPSDSPNPFFTREQPAPSSQIAFSWLLHLRWGAVAAQALLVLAGYFLLKINLPYRIIASILLFESVSNLIFLLAHRQHRQIADRLFAPVMFLDAVLLSLLLYHSGGPMNPFTFLYLIHITLGAILMPSIRAWGLAVFTTLCYAALFYLPAKTGLPESRHPLPGVPAPLDDPMRIHLQGMWLAFAVSAFFIVFFVGRIRQALARQEGTLAQLESERIKNEKLASLATLAAGAAHEFSTPLATIAVAAGEMLHSLKKRDCDEETRNDLILDTSLIRDQVDRCKDILFQMSADAGEHLGEELGRFTIDELIARILAGFSQTDQSRIRIDNRIPGLSVRMPPRTSKRVLRGLIKNGLDASGPDKDVAVLFSSDRNSLLVTVSDQGCGMTQEQLARASEPFFTTKEPGKGLGLGLFLARSAAERLGGRLSIDSLPGRGSAVTISFGLEQIDALPESQTITEALNL